ncbi:MAG: ABC transporter permease [Firmicutes bacterium]|nr:ABC transporter permease [Bacillota bacterium]
MLILLKIAFRNIIQNRKRTLLTGLTLVISCTLLFFSFAIVNGVSRQVIKKYRDFQSGDVTVVWKNVKKIDPSDPSRLFFSGFDIKQDLENKAALRRLDRFLNGNREAITACYKSVRGEGMLDTGRYAAYSIIYGVTAAELHYFQTAGIFHLVAGQTPFDPGIRDGICISDDAARKNEIHLGDWVILDCTTSHGLVNSLEYQVVGFYKSSSGFDSIYVYLPRDSALELLDQEPEYFQSARIYLKNPKQAGVFAAKLDQYLLRQNDLLRAESLQESAQFYTAIAGFLKSLFSFFVIFLLVIIAVGIRAAIRMNLFERMREFGTLRATGFNRTQCLFIVFGEIFILAVASLALALVITLFLVLIFGQTGIYTGPGAIAYALGGESIYPVFLFTDTFTALLVMALFSIFAPLKPGLRLCYQKITDLLAQDLKPGPAALRIIKIWFPPRVADKTD